MRVDMPCETRDQVARLRRFDLDVPAKWRASGAQNWHEAVVKNASASGVLVLGTVKAEVGDELELWLFTHACRPGVADIVCDSVVVRCEQHAADEQPFRIAMQFHKYQFRPAQA